MNRDRLTSQLIYDEGEVRYAYQDSEDFWTIGVGRMIDKRRGGGLSPSEIRFLLDNDIDDAYNECVTKWPWFVHLNAVRQEVILNMAFNMGVPTLSEFKLTLKAVAEGDFLEASREMLDSLWATQVGDRAIRLSNAMRTGRWAD